MTHIYEVIEIMDADTDYAYDTLLIQARSITELRWFVKDYIENDWGINTDQLKITPFIDDEFFCVEILSDYVDDRQLIIEEINFID